MRRDRTLFGSAQGLNAYTQNLCKLFLGEVMDFAKCTNIFSKDTHFFLCHQLVSFLYEFENIVWKDIEKIQSQSVISVLS